MDIVRLLAARQVPLKEWQVVAFDKHGNLNHAGVQLYPCLPSQEEVEVYQADWERWADGIAREHPDCPTAACRRSTCRIVIYPLWSPDSRTTYVVGPLE